jgi:uncharacterized membrane protein
MALHETLKSRWFWYFILCVLSWGAWALASKLGSWGIPPQAMQFLFTTGTLPVAATLLIARRGKLEKSGVGISYAVLNGVLAGVGGLTLFAAYHTNSNTSVVTAATALYPMITVVLGALILCERLTLVQMFGPVFAALAIVAFSL